MQPGHSEVTPREARATAREEIQIRRLQRIRRKGIHPNAIAGLLIGHNQQKIQSLGHVTREA
jgi:hypothetical protein